MSRKPLGSQLKVEWPRQGRVNKTVRRIPPSSTVSLRYEKTSERLQAVEYEEHADTIYFKPKDNNTRTIGYVRFNLHQHKKELNIDFLEVYKPFRKNDYGREIYQWTENRAKEKGIKKITVISLEEAVGFWKKMGLKRGVWSKPGYKNMVKALSDS